MVAAARSTTYAYDPVTGGLATETTPEGTIHREYDPATGRLTRTYTADNDTSYTYNDLGQLWKVAATKLNGQTANLVTEHTYTAAGALDTITHHNDPGSTADDVAWDYDYDQLNRLEVLNVSNGAGFHLLRQEINYESDGQRDQMLEKRYGGDSATPGQHAVSLAANHRRRGCPVSLTSHTAQPRTFTWTGAAGEGARPHS